MRPRLRRHGAGSGAAARSGTGRPAVLQRRERLCQRRHRGASGVPRTACRGLRDGAGVRRREAHRPGRRHDPAAAQRRHDRAVRPRRAGAAGGVRDACHALPARVRRRTGSVGRRGGEEPAPRCVEPLCADAHSGHARAGARVAHGVRSADLAAVLPVGRGWRGGTGAEHQAPRAGREAGSGAGLGGAVLAAPKPASATTSWPRRSPRAQPAWPTARPA